MTLDNRTRFIPSKNKNSLKNKENLIISNGKKTFVVSENREKLKSSDNRMRFRTSDDEETFITSDDRKISMPSDDNKTLETLDDTETFVATNDREKFMTKAMISGDKEAIVRSNAKKMLTKSDDEVTFVTSGDKKIFMTLDDSKSFVTSNNIETFITSDAKKLPNIKKMMTSDNKETFLTSDNIENFVTSDDKKIFVTSDDKKTFLTSAEKEINMMTYGRKMFMTSDENKPSMTSADREKILISDDRKTYMAPNETEKFMQAALNGHMKDVITLSSKFSNDVEVLSEALIRSCYYGFLDITKWLMEHTAADVNYRGEFSVAPILCVRKLHTSGQDTETYITEKSSYSTPLLWACRKVRMSLSLYLLNEAVDLDVNVTDRDGNSALHYAVWCSKNHDTQLHLACLKALPKVSSLSEDRNIQWHGAWGEDNISTVSSLVHLAGRDINAQNNDGNTPLHYACSNSLGNAVEILMIVGADETITNDDGLTPAQLAKKYGHKDILNLLNRNSLTQVLLLRKKIKSYEMCYYSLIVMSQQIEFTRKVKNWYRLISALLVRKAIYNVYQQMYELTKQMVEPMSPTETEN